MSVEKEHKKSMLPAHPSRDISFKLAAGVAAIPLLLLPVF
jgi:hypothetical protein